MGSVLQMAATVPSHGLKSDPGLNMAIALRQPPKGCIHHTDRGS
jgi:hypothetical protein